MSCGCSVTRPCDAVSTDAARARHTGGIARAVAEAGTTGDDVKRGSLRTIACAVFGATVLAACGGAAQEATTSTAPPIQPASTVAPAPTVQAAAVTTAPAPRGNPTGMLVGD